MACIEKRFIFALIFWNRLFAELLINTSIALSSPGKTRPLFTTLFYFVDFHIQHLFDPKRLYMLGDIVAPASSYFLEVCL